MQQSAHQHQPVLLEAALRALNIQSDGRYIDGTYGRGGHARAVLSQLGPQGKLMVIDRDPVAVATAKTEVDTRLTIVHGLFAKIPTHLCQQGWSAGVQGILLDLGVSSPQLADAQRGFSFLQDGPLDMRMDPTTGITAAEWLNSASASEIALILKNFGEERFAHRIAQQIVAYRKQHPLLRTQQLAALVAATLPFHEREKHPATRTFQAIRIYINSELTQLQQALQSALQVLAPHGRLVVISFHSLEDRIVKQFMRQQSQGDSVPPGIPLMASQIRQQTNLRILGKEKTSLQERRMNRRARSAILRVAEKLEAIHATCT